MENQFAITSSRIAIPYSGTTIIDEAKSYPSPNGVSSGDTGSDCGTEDGEDPEALPVYPDDDAMSSGCRNVGFNTLAR